jgi:hypothetical protein
MGIWGCGGIGDLGGQGSLGRFWFSRCLSGLGLSESCV